MSHRFDEMIDRRGTDSLKWDMLKKRFGEDDLLPMWVADMDFRAPQAVLDALQERVSHGIFGYNAHSSKVDEAVQNWLERRYQWSVDPSAFVYTSGVVPTISFIIQAFTEENDEIVIQTPVYYPFYEVIKRNNRKIVKNPLQLTGKQYEMDLEQLESAITEKTKMLLLCHPHNPGGRVWTKDELSALATICKKHNLLVVSDEIHADILFGGRQHIPMASLDEELAQQMFTCLAPSKTFNLAGIQTSYVVIENERYRSKLQKHIADTFIGMSNSFSEIACEAAYRHGEEWLEELIAYVYENYKTTADFIQAHMPKIKVIEPEGTYLLWLDFSGLDLSPDERKDWLIHEAKVGFNHGAMFGEEGKDFERMNLACPKTTLMEGLHRLKAAYEKRGF